MNKIQVLVTGKYFLGSGFRAVEPVLEELISSAQEEIHIVAYLITESAIPLLNLLESAIQRGIKVTFVVNDLNNHPNIIKKKLYSYSQNFPYVRIVNFQDPEGSQLHAKILIVDRKKAVVGSANFSWGGLINNHEVAILIENSYAWKLATLIDNLINKYTS